MRGGSVAPTSAGYSGSVPAAHLNTKTKAKINTHAATNSYYNNIPAPKIYVTVVERQPKRHHDQQQLHKQIVETVVKPQLHHKHHDQLKDQIVDKSASLNKVISQLGKEHPHKGKDPVVKTAALTNDASSTLNKLHQHPDPSDHHPLVDSTALVPEVKFTLEEAAGPVKNSDNQRVDGEPKGANAADQLPKQAGLANDGARLELKENKSPTEGLDGAKNGGEKSPGPHLVDDIAPNDVVSINDDTGDDSVDDNNDNEEDPAFNNESQKRSLGEKKRIFHASKRSSWQRSLGSSEHKELSDHQKAKNPHQHLNQKQSGSDIFVGTGDNNYAILSSELAKVGWLAVSVNQNDVFIVTANKRFQAGSWKALDPLKKKFLHQVMDDFLVNTNGLLFNEANVPSSQAHTLSLNPANTGDFLATRGSIGGGYTGAFGNSYLSNTNSPAYTSSSYLSDSSSPVSSSSANYVATNPSNNEAWCSKSYNLNSAHGTGLNETLDGDVYYLDLNGNLLNIFSSTVHSFCRDGLSAVFRDANYFAYSRPDLPLNLNRFIVLGTNVFLIYNDGTVLVKPNWALDSTEYNAVLRARNEVNLLSMNQEQQAQAVRKNRSDRHHHHDESLNDKLKKDHLKHDELKSALLNSNGKNNKEEAAGEIVQNSQSDNKKVELVKKIVKNNNIVPELVSSRRTFKLK